MSQEESRRHSLQQHKATFEADLLNLTLQLVKFEQAPQNSEQRKKVFLLLDQLQKQSAKSNFKVIAEVATIVATALDEMVVYNLTQDGPLYDFLFEGLAQIDTLVGKMSRDEQLDFDQQALEEKFLAFLERRRAGKSVASGTQTTNAQNNPIRLELLKSLSARVAQNEQARQEEARLKVLPAFQETATSLLQQLRRYLILLENEPASVTYLEHVMKLVHQLGLQAAQVKVAEIELICSALENILQDMRGGFFQLTPGLNGVFFGTLETLGQLADLYAKGEKPNIEVAKLMTLLGEFHKQPLTHKLLSLSILDSSYTTTLGLNLYPELTKALHLLARRKNIAEVKICCSGGELALSPAKVDKLYKATFSIVLNLLDSSDLAKPTQSMLECSFAARQESEKILLEISCNVPLDFEAIRQHASNQHLFSATTDKTLSNAELFEFMLNPQYQPDANFKHSFVEIREAGVGLRFSQQTDSAITLELAIAVN